ncbi:integrase family protein (plasmid) [halophilic archaeon DL31]|jgi:integrase/recombinase XerD|nr:integrase family protein [halophilic archaeon DL31]
MERNDKGQFSSDITLNGRYKELHEAYLEALVQADTNDRTFDARQKGTLYWLSFCQDNDLEPFEAEDSDVRSYFKQIRNQYANTTLGGMISSVTMFYETLMHDPDIDTEMERVPTHKFSLYNDYDISTSIPDYIQVHAREAKEDIKTADMERVRRLYGHAPGKKPETKTRNELMLRLLATTAVRGDELVRIREDNVDKEERSIYLNSSKLEPHQDLYNRYVFYPPELDYLMTKWTERHRKSFSSYADDSPYLFLSTHSESLEPSTVSRMVKQTAFNAGEQEPLMTENREVKQWFFTSHRLRHSCISYWVNSCPEIGIAKAAMMAGHEKVDTTMDYTSPDWDAVREGYIDSLPHD